ncbi:hypothetical protein BIY23_02010 [Wolbachia pipientis]|uniref:Msp4/OMP-like domain-containing protein n=1 Tax=Wolbachia pipientis TaxID=955 RepID=A0A1E7QKA4_WOLPI|nr:P44/Msp2 family outer membrane protein [Wolbachia pipientis]OEY86786.1 hypothetical protein BIY23_02010 [Wolbachia pipientis]
MSYKRLFSATALATLLSVSNVVFSDLSNSNVAFPDSMNTIEEDDEEFALYLRVQGNLLYGGSGEIKGKENASNLTKNAERSAQGWNKKGEFGNYKPEYNISWKNIAGALGYKMGTIRAETEVLYSRLELKNDGYKSDKSASYLEFTRDTADTPSIVSNAVQPAGDGGNAANPSTVSNAVKSAGGSGNAANPSTVSNAVKSAGGSDNAAFKMDNQGFTTKAVMLNVYCDDIVAAISGSGQNMPLMVYVGGGLGMAKVNFLESESGGFWDGLKVAFQGRVGVSYAFDSIPAVRPYIGGHYFGMFSDEFKDIKPTNEIKGKGLDGQDKSSTTATVKSRYHMYGIEAGITLFPSLL